MIEQFPEETRHLKIHELHGVGVNEHDRPFIDPAPAAAPNNLWLEPGEQNLEELIASTGRGLLVTELIGMGFQPITGDYSRGAAGFWIEGGEIAYPVEEITIAGNLGDMLQSIDAIGSDLVWLGRTASPSVRVSNMTVAGE